MATFTINQYLGYTKKLQKDLEKSFPINLNETFAKTVTRRIRRRAPNGSTGSLKKVESRVLNNRTIDILGPGHATYVDAGVSPKKWLPLEVARAHTAYPGSTAGKKIQPKIPRGSIDGWFFADNKGIGKGFITESVKSIRKDAQQIIEKEFLRIAK